MVDSIVSESADIANLCDTEPFCIFNENPNSLNFQKDNLNISCINLNSILCENRLDQIQSIMNNGCFTAFSVCESKLDKTISDNNIKIPGFQTVRKDRNRFGGGLILYLREDVCFRRLPLLESKVFEMICVEMFISGKRIILSCCYRPPNEDNLSHVSFLNDLNLTLEKLRNENCYISIIQGDFNLGNSFAFYDNLTPKPLDNRAKAIFENVGNYTQIIDIGTRYSKHSVSLIDLIFVNRPDFIDKACVYSQVADHCGVAISLLISSKRAKPRIREKLCFNEMTIQQWAEFKNYLLEFRIDENATSDFHCESLTRYLQEGISKFVPKIKFKEKTNYVPWDNASIRRLLIKKNKTYKCFRAQSNQFKALRPDDQNYYAVFTRVSQKYQKFRDASKSYKTASRREKNRYFNGLKSVWSNPNIPPRKKFSILKKLSKTEKNNFIPPLIENNQTIHDSKNKAEIFNKFFTNKSQVLSPNDSPPELQNIQTNEILENFNTSPYEIGPILKALKNSNYSPCGIPASFLKLAYSNTGSVITNLISELLNKILYSGEYPNIWKLAHITPVFKCKDKCDKSNYRPISILPTLSKITEAVIHKRLLDHLLSNNIITKYQAAYIPADSTSQQLLSIIHQIKSAWANNKIAQGVFLDISCAFDAVWHHGLIKKLEQINIGGTALQLFKSYLADRKAVTVVDENKSSILPVEAGVPQGSRLGPLLFVIYINDLVNDLESSPFIYADDTTLLATGKSTFETTNILNRDLAKISKWAHIWKIKFNPLKSKDMIFSNSLLPSYPTIMGLHCIERVTLHKHLGIYLTSDLSWNKQIESIIKKVNLKLSIIWQVKGLSRQCLDILYKLHVRSSIDYGISVFGPSLNNQQLEKLDNLQYRAAKIVTGALKFTSKENLQRELGWENTRTRIEYICLTQFHKIVHRETTPLIRDCLPPLLKSKYPTKRTFEYYKDKKRALENSFFPFTIKRWDALDNNIKGLYASDFKLKLKEILKPSRFKHFNCGYKYPNTLHTQLRLKRSNLNAHLHPIGLAASPACRCGFATESVRHFLLYCDLYTLAREQLFIKLQGLLEKKLKYYSKTDLLEILLTGEKPHLPEKYQHNKFIFFAVQRFLLRTKRLFYDKNGPNNQTQPLDQNG